MSSLIGLSVVLVACGGGGGNNSSNNGNSGGDTAAAADTSASAAAAASDAASTPAAASDTSASDAGAASAPDAASTPTPAAFYCATGYTRLDIPSGTTPGSKFTMVTNDNIATLAITMSTNGLPLPLTLCLGRPDSLPAGVVADYAYEIKTSNYMFGRLNYMLTLNFNTNAPVTGLPAIEQAIVTSSGVTYAPTVAGPLVSAKPNYSVAARVDSPGLYIIRLSK
ncbi:hypothetical protein [Paraburkholderia bannensis]|uniref:hypothetical protein n=1 Tax=Paraburkholderia bannensis TaxID=765414 RepID=UPI000B0AE933|nr:hypothetical protein [Paraburkholderia bannensis]